MRYGEVTLGELIATLAEEDPDLVLPYGFGLSHSYRGFYDELSFDPAEDVPVRAMLAEARYALGSTFQGYKGGDFTMGEHTPCWIAESHEGRGEKIGWLLLDLMIAAGKGVPPIEAAK